MHRIVRIMDNGTVDTIDGLTMEGAQTVFYASIDLETVVHVVWFYLDHAWQRWGVSDNANGKTFQ